MTEKRGPGRARKADVAKAAMATIEANDEKAEVFAGDPVRKGAQNTIFINPTDAGVQGNKEVFLIKTWDDGTLYYIDPDHLDTIDRKRLTRALRRANKSNFELWEVLKDTTLSNSRNALDYFHQVTRTYKPDGALSAPTAQDLTNRVKRAEEGFIERGGLADTFVDSPNSLL